MNTHNRLLAGLRQRLINLLAESAEIFVQLRPVLLFEDRNEEQVFGTSNPYKGKSEQELAQLQQQNEQSTRKVLKAIEDEFVTYDIERHFIPSQQVLIEVPKEEKKPENWLTEQIQEEEAEEYRRLINSIDR